MHPFLIYLSGFATGMIVLVVACLILVGRCVAGDKANDSEHTDLPQ
jgi:hypothetical protein